MYFVRSASNVDTSGFSSAAADVVGFSVSDIVLEGSGGAWGVWDGGAGRCVAVSVSVGNIRAGG